MAGLIGQIRTGDEELLPARNAPGSGALRAPFSTMEVVMTDRISRRVRRFVLILAAASLGACHFHGGHCWEPHHFCRPVPVCR